MELRRRQDSSVKYDQMAQVKLRRPIAVMFDLMADYMSMTRAEAMREAIFRLFVREGCDKPMLDVHPSSRRIRSNPEPDQDIDTILMQTFLTYDQWDRLIKVETAIGITTPMVLRQAIYEYMFVNGYKFNRPNNDLPTMYGEDDA